jgi:hypothetical protein
MRFIFIVCSFVLAFASPRASASDAASDQISAATAAWADAFNQRDLEGVLAVYADNAVLGHGNANKR